jgi:ketosteroid isomerase-like protein
MEAGLRAPEVGATPEGGARAFAEAVLARDPEAAAALFSIRGVLLTPDGAEVRGRAALREALAQMTMAQPLIRVEAERVLVAASLALVSQDWTVYSQGTGDELFEQSLPALLAMVPDEQGWQVHIAAPWGM